MEPRQCRVGYKGTSGAARRTTRGSQSEEPFSNFRNAIPLVGQRGGASQSKVYCVLYVGTRVSMASTVDELAQSVTSPRQDGWPPDPNASSSSSPKRRRQNPPHDQPTSSMAEAKRWGVHGPIPEGLECMVMMDDITEVVSRATTTTTMPARTMDPGAAAIAQLSTPAQPNLKLHLPSLVADPGTAATFGGAAIHCRSDTARTPARIRRMGITSSTSASRRGPGSPR